MDSFQIGVSELPRDENVTFQDSAFFTRPPGVLPSPAQVRAAAKEADKNWKPLQSRPLPVRFPTMKLMVKYGSYIQVAEGQCLWAIRRLLGDEVPVPEVYGWRRDGIETFIYMELIEGDTLEDRWGDLVREEKLDICAQLRRIVDTLRQLRQDPADRFIGEEDGFFTISLVFTFAHSRRLRRTRTDL